MEGLSFVHILLLMLVLLLVFGAKRIPEMGKSLGQGIKEFKKSLKEAGSDEPAQPLPPPPPAQSSTLPSGGEPKRLSQ
ncbi:MAG TPA: twin-arginine translocase TatA/TatE family subunit [Gemmatimonadales bacterium]|nr:twin-arginine translocase TatA/TatE family subunit [Gemmatimonadales bacterium]